MFTNRRVSAASVCVVILLGFIGATTVIAGAGTTASAPISRSALVFHDSMRKLWEDHVTWTRNVIISFQVNVPDPSVALPDLGNALDRLFQNQVDTGNAIKPYYGDARGNELTALLHDHIAIEGEILQAVKTGDSAAYAEANARWYANAHDIAVHLSTTLNPAVGSLTQWDSLIKDHLDRTTAEVVARRNGDWTGDVAAYDNVHAQALGIADTLSNAIIANFPTRFRP